MIRSVTLDHDDRTVLLMAAGVALVVGILAAATSPLVLIAALIGGGVLTLILARPVSGLWLFVLVVASLPFGVIPVPLAGAQLTFVDAVLIATFAAVLFRALSGSLRIPLGAPGVALLAFVVVAMVAFAAAAISSPITSELVRRTGKLLVSLLFFLIARALLTTPERLTGLTRWLMYAGAIQGAIGAALSRLMPETQLALLS
ncbi:MAG TPA: hypothetical protein VF937_03440, partial [Chloroflexota bacterium]